LELIWELPGGTDKSTAPEGAGRDDVIIDEEEARDDEDKAAPVGLPPMSPAVPLPPSGGFEP